MFFSSASQITHRARLRLKAGLLAFLFAIGTLVPWMHILAPGHQGVHACRHALDTVCTSGRLPALTSHVHDDADSCWICESVTSLLHPNRFLDATGTTATEAVPALTARAPQAPHTLRIDPANRSQAPPSRA